MGSSSSKIEDNKPSQEPSLAASTSESNCPVAPSKREAIFNVYNQRIDTGALKTGEPSWLNLLMRKESTETI